VIYSTVKSKIYLLMERAKKKANAIGMPVLVSSVAAVENIDLPAFFATQKEKFSGSRFFWSEPDRALTFVGLGNVMHIASADVDRRYSGVERQWQDVLQHSLVEKQIPRHTGPLLFGGFSFDSYKAQSTIWQDFADHSFVTPQYMLTEHNEKTWLTMNRFVYPESMTISDEQTDEELDVEVLKDIEHAAAGRIRKEEFGTDKWMQSVKEAAQSIRDGQLQKVVLARNISLTAEREFDIADIVRRLLLEQSNTYVFAIDRGSSCFVGATPERLVKRAGNEFLTLSLAGSIARGATAEEDEQLGQFLIQDLKNLHEHELAVHMIMDTMEELCESVVAPSAPILRKLKDIQHLATPISGQAREGCSLLQAVGMLHPTPALGGMPREAAIEAIRTLEDMDRGWYAAPIGWIDCEMNGEFVAAIRSALIQGTSAVLYAGCGIVGDSDPVSEFHETSLKFRPMLNAMQAFHTDI